MIKIKIDDFVTLNQGITSEEGQPIYQKIVDGLSRNEDVTLDFEGMTFLTTAFLNVAIGTLYRDYTSEQLQTRLNIVNANDETIARIKKVTDNAKAFYSDEDKFNQTVEDILNGNM
ncbi:MAG: STAS-like domain-containing protein [Prevotella sp.]|nr:STAS-like domain-containing protein [Prevotella sp.]MDO4933169.1 STAS-like domain-containing protein [Prevotella sp.]